MQTITKRHLRVASKKRAERQRRTFMWLSLLIGVSFVGLATGLSLIYQEDISDPHAGMRCVQFEENEEGFEECVKWEREKTTRSKIIQQQ